MTYDDGYRLSRGSTSGWSWQSMPRLPWKLTSAAARPSSDPTFYVFGGADYDGKVGYYTDTDRDSKLPRLGGAV
jgi:hypothetical protein